MSQAFTQQGARSRGLVIGIAIMLLAESVAVHAFLLGKPWWVHVLLLVANGSTIWFLWAHDRALGARPIVIDERGIHVRHGLLVSAEIPISAIASVTRPSWKELPSDVASGYIKASGFDDPNVLITMRDPVQVNLGLGIRRSARVIGLKVDDADTFVICAARTLVAGD